MEPAGGLPWFDGPAFAKATDWQAVDHRPSGLTPRGSTTNSAPGYTLATKENVASPVVAWPAHRSRNNLMLQRPQAGRLARSSQSSVEIGRRRLVCGFGPGQAAAAGRSFGPTLAMMYTA
jgi:hypothetical protein